DDVRLQIAGFLEAFLAVQGGVDAVSVELQLEPVHLEDRGIVFDEENVDQVFIGLGRRARAGAAARLTFHNTPLGAKQYRRSWCISPPLREAIRRTPREAYGHHSSTPEKLRPSEGEGPKRGAKELFRIIERTGSLVNIETVRKYPVRT